MMNQDTFSALADQYMDMVYRVAYHALRSPHDADDVTQEVFLRLLRAGPAFESETHAKHWLIRVTFNESKRLLCSPWRRHTTPLADYEASLSWETPEQEDLFQAVMNLPSRSPARRRLTPLLAAVVLIAALTATALAAFGGLWDWFSREWAARTGQPMGESQTAVIHSLTQRVDQSVTAEGVTVTADSITVGSDSLWVLLRVTGAEFSPTQAYTFSEFDLQITPEAAPGKTTGVSAYGEHFLGLDESGSLLFLFEYTTSIPSEAQLGGGSYQLILSLGSLARGSQGTETEPLCAGPWAFTIPLTVESLSPVRTLAEAEAVVPADDSSAGCTGESSAPSPSIPADRPDSALEGVELPQTETTVVLTDLQLSATGVRFCSDGDVSFALVAAVLADGTVVKSTSSTGFRDDQGIYHNSFQWPVPLDVTQVTALRVGATDIPLA